MMKNKKSSYEDLQGNVRSIKLPEIEVWQNKYPDRNYKITIETPEFTCICPKTGLPDFGTIKIEYIPNKACLELKSLKLYFVAYRNLGIFHEHLVNRILDDVVRACQPRYMKVEGVINPRGGIDTTVVAEYHQKKRGNK